MIRFISKSAIRYKVAHAHLAKSLELRSRTSKNVKKTAITISTPAATERHIVIRICPQDTEVFGSEHTPYSYRKCAITEYGKGNRLYPGSMHQQITVYAKETNEPIRSTI